MKEYQYGVADHKKEGPSSGKIRLGWAGALFGFTLAICVVLIIMAWPGMQVSAAPPDWPAVALKPPPLPLSIPLPAPTSTPDPGEGTGPPLVVEDPPLDDMDAVEREINVSPAGREICIILHQDHLNREAAAFLQDEPDAPFHDVVIALHPGEMTVKTQAEVVGLSVGVEVRARVKAVDCKPKMEITSLAVGGLWTPQFVKDQIAAFIYDSLEQYPDDYPVCWTEIDVKEGEIVLRGVKR